jgi:SRSO17 transposase
MLPACRTAGEPFPMPQFALTRNDIDPFMDELRECHTAFRACLARQAPRDQFFNSMVGQFRALERTSIAPLAVQVEGGKVRAMPRLVSEALWDAAAMRETDHRWVQAEMGEPDGVLSVDETGCVKKGADAVGVARQSCGSLGKVEHGQVGVCAADASRQGYALVDKRLFLPEPWCADASQARRTQGQLPDEVTRQSTPPVAAALVQALHQAGILPCKSRVADCLYGNSPDFWAACEAGVGPVACVATPADTRGWLQPLATTTPTSTSKGKQRTKRGVGTATPPRTVAAGAHALPATFWYRRTGSEGTQGPITYEGARTRLRLCNEGQPTTAVWVLLKRTRGAHPQYWYDLSNAPLRAPLRLFVWRSGVRWAIAQGCEETQTALGMDHYAVRKYPGWHHHMLTGMLAHFFLWPLHSRLAKTSTSADGLARPAVMGSRLASQSLAGG